MTRTRLPQPGAQALEVVPAALWRHWTPHPSAHPLRYCAARPALTVRRWLAQRLTQLLELRLGEQRRRTTGGRVLPVNHPCWPLGVVAFGDLADPVRRIPRTLRNRSGRLSAGEQPEHLPPTALRRLICLPVAPFQLVACQVKSKLYSSHTPILQHRRRSWDHGRRGPPDDSPNAAPPTDATTTTATEVIATTANHPWLTADRGWLEAGQLHLGEPVRLLDGATATVVALHTLPGVGPMWDLSLADVHTFAVGDVQVVVHNCDSPEQFAHERAQELQNSLPDASRGRVTMGVGVTDDGQVLVGTSEGGYLRKGVTLEDGETLAPGDTHHAEQNIMQWAQQNGQNLVAVGAGRPICEACDDVLRETVGENGIASPTRRGFIPFWMR